MKTLDLNNNIKLKILNRKDYEEKNFIVNTICLKIISSHEKNCAKQCATSKEMLENLNSSLFLDDKNALIMFLETPTTPKYASFIILTTDKQNPNVWHTEMIYTHLDKTNCNYATLTLESALDYLKNQKKAKMLTCAVATDNPESINFHEKFIKTHNLPSNCVKENGVYKYSIIIDTEKIKSSNDINELLQ